MHGYEARSYTFGKIVDLILHGKSEKMPKILVTGASGLLGVGWLRI